MRLKIQTNGCFSNALLFQPSLDRQVLGNSDRVDMESAAKGCRSIGRERDKPGVSANAGLVSGYRQPVRAPIRTVSN